MTSLSQLLPQEKEATVDEIVALVHTAQQIPLAIGAEETLKFCSDLSQKLLQDERAQAFPELAALGFWLRAASVRRMVQNYLVAETQICPMPLGVVLHLPPGNVPTLFLYSAVISLLCGNVTIVRLSRKDTPSRVFLIELIGACLSLAPESLRQRLILLRYEPNDAITTSLSQACDLRLIWGGDATVAHIRTLPLPPLANEICFGDRFSASAINANAYLAADDQTRASLINAFYNDLSWFDQFACASPRLLVWIGNEAETDQASLDFYHRLSHHKHPDPNAGVPLAKLNMAYLALHDLPVTLYCVYAPSLTVITLADLSTLSPFKQVAYGFGLLLEARLETLNDLAATAERRDQTLSVWGFSSETCASFVSACGGRGFDRIVPVGQALDFHPIWDGHNLFAAMTRRIQIL